MCKSPSALRDVRIAYVDTYTILAPHRDANHMSSDDDSNATHMDTWKSKCCMPGSMHDGPWKRPPLGKLVFDDFYRIVGRRCEGECVFDKGSSKFLFGEDLMIAVRKGLKLWSKQQPKQCNNLLIKRSSETQSNPGPVNVQLEEESRNSQCVKKHRLKKNSK